jgi:hypothetical protein
MCFCRSINFCLLLPFIVSCTTQREIDLTSENQSPKPPETVNAGVISPDQENYLCLPLSTLGLADINAIETATSSCECVKPEIVEFGSSDSKVERALLLRFVPDSTALLENYDAFNEAPISLAVCITLGYRDGRSHELNVRFKHSWIVVVTIDPSGAAAEHF